MLAETEKGKMSLWSTQSGLKSFGMANLYLGIDPTALLQGGSPNPKPLTVT